MTSTSSSGARSAADQNGSDTATNQVHHGRTLAAWVGALVALVGFLIGGIGFVLPPHPNWVVVIVGAALLLVAIIATIVLRRLGHGAN